MPDTICVQCGKDFVSRNCKQITCLDEPCQRARKRDWQRNKMKTDQEYKANQKQSQKKWQQKNPDYWRKYRAKNPKKAARNRDLQRVRNKLRNQTICNHKERADVIAKMDPSHALPQSLSGYFWLVPIIAKMDPRKIFIHAIRDDYG